MHEFEIGLYCVIPKPGDIWLYTKNSRTDSLHSVRLSKWYYDYKFNIVIDLHKHMTNNSYTVSKKYSDMLETFSDHISSSYSYFISICQNKDHSDEVIKWICNLRELMNEKNYTKLIQFQFSHSDFYSLIENVINKKITPTMGKEILRLMSDNIPLSTCLEMDKFKVASSNDLSIWVKEVFDKNPEQVLKAKENPKVVQFLIGQTMKLAKGACNAAEAKELIEQLLKS